MEQWQANNFYDADRLGSYLLRLCRVKEELTLACFLLVMFFFFFFSG